MGRKERGFYLIKSIERLLDEVRQNADESRTSSGPLCLHFGDAINSLLAPAIRALQR